MLLLKVLILTISVSAVLAAFVTPNNVSPIKNCCDLGFRQLIFSQTVNKPKVYQFKRCCNSSFRVGPAYSNYQLSISGSNGITANDPFVTGSLLNGMPFTTKDRDNDNWSRNCAEDRVGHAGGWWYNICTHIFLNNQYKNYYGIAVNNIWRQFSFVEMKIRPINCKL